MVGIDASPEFVGGARGATVSGARRCGADDLRRRFDAVFSNAAPLDAAPGRGGARHVAALPRRTTGGRVRRVPAASRRCRRAAGGAGAPWLSRPAPDQFYPTASGLRGHPQRSGLRRGARRDRPASDPAARRNGPRGCGPSAVACWDALRAAPAEQAESDRRDLDLLVPALRTPAGDWWADSSAFALGGVGPPDAGCRAVHAYDFTSDHAPCGAARRPTASCVVIVEKSARQRAGRGRVQRRHESRPTGSSGSSRPTLSRRTPSVGRCVSVLSSKWPARTLQQPVGRHPMLVAWRQEIRWPPESAPPGTFRAAPCRTGTSRPEPREVHLRRAATCHDQGPIPGPVAAPPGSRTFPCRQGRGVGEVVWRSRPPLAQAAPNRTSGVRIPGSSNHAQARYSMPAVGSAHRADFDGGVRPSWPRRAPEDDDRSAYGGAYWTRSAPRCPRGFQRPGGQGAEQMFVAHHRRTPPA